MDVISMLQNATIVDHETDEVIGGAFGFSIVNGRMSIRIHLIDGAYEDDPDGGEEEDDTNTGSVLSLQDVRG